jgi:hypothetical protein
MEHRVNLLVALGRSAGTLPTPWNAGIVGMGWVTEDFAESEVKQGQRVVVLNLQKVPFQGFWEITRPVGAASRLSASVLGESVKAIFCNIEVKIFPL